MDAATLREKAARCRRLAKATTDKRAIEALLKMADECDALLLLQGEHAGARPEPSNERGEIAPD